MLKIGSSDWQRGNSWLHPLTRVERSRPDLQVNPANLTEEMGRGVFRR